MLQGFTLQNAFESFGAAVSMRGSSPKILRGYGGDRSFGRGVQEDGYRGTGFWMRLRFGVDGL